MYVCNRYVFFAHSRQFFLFTRASVPFVLVYLKDRSLVINHFDCRPACVCGSSMYVLVRVLILVMGLLVRFCLPSAFTFISHNFLWNVQD